LFFDVVVVVAAVDFVAVAAAIATVSH